MLDEKRFRTRDGTVLACRSAGHGLPVLLAGGLGCGWPIWTRILERLGDRYEFVGWDYRGLGDSSVPTDPATLTVPQAASDALGLLDSVGAARFAVCGFAIGVQVSLELFRRAPDRVAALVLANGVSGRSWSTLALVPLLQRTMPSALGLLRRWPRLLERVAHDLAESPETAAWVRRLGLTGNVDHDLFMELAHSYARLDIAMYARALQNAWLHDASDVLGDVDVPTLVIVGDRDPLTPRRSAEHMVASIAGAELMVVAGGTHFMLIEQSDMVSLRIEKFFAERGYGRSAG